MADVRRESMPSAEIREAEIKRQRERAERQNQPNLRERLLAEHKENREKGIRKKVSRRWEELIARIPTVVPTMGAEVGVWKGSTAFEVLNKRPLNTHIMIDPWKAPEPESEYALSPGNVQKSSQDEFDAVFHQVFEKAVKYGDKAVVMRTTSKEASAEIADHSLDYVFIDAEHTYEGVSSDIALWRDKVKHGGWLGGHDYDNLPNFPGVRKAVDEAFGGEIELGADHTWFVRLL